MTGIMGKSKDSALEKSVIDGTPAERWTGGNISFSADQLEFMTDISSKQLGVLATFTQKQIDALRWAMDINAKRHVH